MKKKYKGILFDFDGTLVDSKQDIASCVNMVHAQMGLSPLPREEIYGYIGNGVPHLMQCTLKKALEDEPSHLLDESINLFRKYYGDHLLDETCCYPDVFETLATLSSFQKGVITNKPKDFTMRIMKGLDIDSYFTVIIGGDEVSNKKPHPEGVLKALTMIKLNPEEVIMVGDSYTDIESGYQAGVTTCFVTYGFGQLKKTKANFTIHSFNELNNIVYS